MPLPWSFTLDMAQPQDGACREKMSSSPWTFGENRHQVLQRHTSHCAVTAPPPAGPVLPYGDTLHYAGCGCPPRWRDQARLADAVDQEVQGAFREMQLGHITPTRSLVIAYMLPHHNVTGGMKCLVEHIRLLRARGHK